MFVSKINVVWRNNVLEHPYIMVIVCDLFHKIPFWMVSLSANSVFIRSFINGTILFVCYLALKK